MKPRHVLFTAVAGLLIAAYVTAEPGKPLSLQDRATIDAGAARLTSARLLRPYLRDPGSLSVGSAWKGRGVRYCGTASARNGFGGMTGQKRFMAGDHFAAVDDGSMYFAANWRKLCALEVVNE